MIFIYLKIPSFLLQELLYFQKSSLYFLYSLFLRKFVALL